MSVVTDTTTLLHRVYDLQVGAERVRDELGFEPAEYAPNLSSESLANALAWSPQRINHAIDYAEEQGWIECDESLGAAPYCTYSIQLSVSGRIAVEKHRELGYLASANAPAITDADARPTLEQSARELNKTARRLLAVLRSCHLEAAGAHFSLKLGDATLKELQLDASAFMLAGRRLIARGLAEATDKFGGVTITARGVQVAEDPGLLARELPVSKPKENDAMAAQPDRKKVFVIHGRNERVRHEMGVFLRTLGLEPLWFRDVRKNMGGTVQIIKVVERGMDEAQGVLALFTPDEFSALRPELRRMGESGDAVERWQARPNVLFEAGLAYGRDPDRVAFALFGDAKLFTDASGMHVFWPTNDHGPDSYRAQLRGLLAGGMKCDVNMHSDDWMTAGDFNAATAGLSGVSPKDPFATTVSPSAPPPIEVLDAGLEDVTPTHPTAHYKKKLRVVLKNVTDSAVTVRAPRWIAESADVNCHPPMTGTLQAEGARGWKHGRWGDWDRTEQLEMSVQPGAIIRAWMGLDPALTEEDFRRRHETEHVGTLLLPLTIEGKAVDYRIRL